MLTRDMIVKFQDIPKPEVVEVPEWGGSVGVKVMNGLQRDEFESLVQSRCDKDGKPIDIKGVKARLLTLTLCDGEGKLLFSEADVDVLLSKSGEVLNSLFKVAQRVNKLSEGDIEVARKNS